MPGPRARRALPVALALGITAYGAALRLDALVEKYGPVDHPGWVRVLVHVAASAGAALRPFALGWPPIDHPYVGGDPINYLKYAREMRGFYQAHLREPVFLALTRAFLWLLSNQDVAVSFASLAGSVLAIAGTYLLGASLTSPPWGLLAALIMAIERENITWAPDGWRDDTFTAVVLFAAWAFVRVHRNPTVWNGVLLGVTSAAACLTRITAVSFILPGMVWLLIDSPRDARRARGRSVAVALGALIVLVAPYLVNCAIQLGDPLIAINYHTGYYRYGEGLPSQQPMSAMQYLQTKVGRSPLTTIDTAMVGVFVVPFETKWTGLAPWLRPARFWAAVAGLLMLPFIATGRLLLVILLGSLVPYAFTWNVGGGGEWRFTMHAYPFYIVAACYAFARLLHLVLLVRRDRSMPSWSRLRPGLIRSAVTGAVVLLASVLYLSMPWFAFNETLAQGQDLTVGAGTRDVAFFRHGWSPPHQEGLVTVRVSLAQRAVIWIPLPARRSYDLTLRFDPVAPALQHRVEVLLNGRLVGRIGLTWDPARVGSYRIHLSEEQVRTGANELILIPDAVVSRGDAGPRFAWVDQGASLGLRLWYVRILP
jgi:4-amino-4-deoxy-L-arabinose transferase-like glycosyltransferase